MAQSLFRTQTKGLLLRTWHYQRRQRCSNFCNFIVPALFMVLLSVLGRVIKGREVISFPFERAPKGAFAPRPFDPARCAQIVFDVGIEAARRRCGRDPFVPKYTVPFYADPSVRDLVGSRNVTGGDEAGVLAGFSLMPFVYPGVLPSDPPGGFSETQSPYDGVLLHASFEGRNESDEYLGFLQVAKAGQIDLRYEVETVQEQSRGALQERIFDSWFQGIRFLPLYSTALSFEAAEQDEDTFSLDATVYYNESTVANCTVACPLVSNVMRLDDAVYNYVTGGNRALAYLRRMPAIDVSLELGFIQLAIGLTLGLTSHFWLPSFLQFLVFERVTRLRAMMSMMGLKRTQYWFGTYVGLFVQYAISILLVAVVGWGMGIAFFAVNTPLSYLILFFLWGNVLIAFAMVLVPFFSSPQTAQTVGWLFVLLVNIVGGPYLGRILRDDDTGEGTWFAIMLLPSFAFLRSIYYAGALNGGAKGVVLGSETYAGFELGMCRGEGPFCRSYAFLAAEWVILMLLAAYFDRVLPSAVGSRLHPLFMFGFKKKTKFDVDAEEKISHEGQDVIDEENRAVAIVEKVDTEPFDGVVLYQLSKTYPAKPPVKALQNLSLIARRNEVLCILAHNGAGKTTAFRTLVGELEATSGTAYVNGNSIIDDMASVRRSMGVAPQQDILWDVLTAQEHLFFYGRVKNLSGQALKDAVAEALESVQLSFAKKRKVSALSGGMKRRLSVSIAMIGNPDFIILDEPSTGLDILAREKLWEAINRTKENKAVIMTTHSLEEAEMLSNRVAIMTQGKLKCIGKAEELKLRLGKGHHLSVSVPADKVAALHDLIMDVAPGASLETQLGGNLEYVLPKSFAISEIFGLMERKRDELEVRDWSINQATLEDVFLEVTERSRREESIGLSNFDP